MKDTWEHHGVVVPMVTPITAGGQLDESAVRRLVDFLLAGRVDGIFVLGTTGESASVPRSFRRRLVECTADRVQHRAKVYAGIGDLYPKDVAAGNEYLQAGADALVARPPIGFLLEKVLPWLRSLLDGVEGPLLLYNMPATTNISIPLETIAQLIGHPNLAGIKDSEHDLKRLEDLLRRFGKQPRFSIFVGVGKLMAQGLKMGAVGIVPSVGNLIPEVCRHLYGCGQRGDWAEAERQAEQMKAVSALYQDGRTLSQSLAALKGAMWCLGLCEPHVLPPLQPLPPAELEEIRRQMIQLRLLT
jgi:2-dehydro-3-deoxy-D-pentonate aldolase